MDTKVLRNHQNPPLSKTLKEGKEDPPNGSTNLSAVSVIVVAEGGWTNPGAGARDRTGTDLLGPRDFKSLASANSATPAHSTRVRDNSTGF